MAREGMRIGTPQIIHESIDGETIIINLETGTYYSAKGSAALVWALVDQNPGVAESKLVEGVAASYGTTVESVETGVVAFLAGLRSDNLVVSADQGLDAPIETLATREPYVAPNLETYTDMQDLVLLDPVHQVDEAGWPAARPDASLGHPAQA